MGKVLWAAGVCGTVLGNNATRYLPHGCTWLDMGLSTLSGSASETEIQITHRSSGTLSKASIYLSTNGVSATSTLKSRKNGADGNISVSITASTTGRFEDTSNSDSYADGDEGCWKLTTGLGGSSLTPRTISAQFEADTNTVQWWVLDSISTSGIATASTTHYHCPAGRWQGSNATANNAKIEPGCGGTWQNMYLYVYSNARTSSSTLRNRINAANGSMSITVGSAATGVFEDTSNSDSISAGDDCDLSWTSGSGTGSCPIPVWKTEIETTDGKFTTANGNASSGMGVSGGTTRYTSVGGSAVDATEANCQNKIPFAVEGSYLTCYVSANTNAATCPVYLRDDGADTALTFTIGSTASGQFKDTSNMVSVAANSLICYKAIPGSGGGTVTFRNFTCTFVDAQHTSAIPLSTLTLTGKTPSATVTDNIFCSLPSASLTLSPKTPGVETTESASDSCSLPAASLTITVNVPGATKTEHVWSGIPAASLTLSAQTPSATLAPLSSQISAISLSLTQNAPSATLTENVFAAVPAASLTLTANTPSLTLAPLSCEIPSVSLTLTANTPQTTLGALSSQIPAGSLTLSAQTPQNTTTENMWSGLPAASLTLTANAPGATLAPLSCELPAASLTLIAQIPSFTNLATDSAQIPTASLSLAANAPSATVTEYLFCQLAQAALTLTANAPALTLAPLSCQFPNAALTLSANAPGATTTLNAFSQLAAQSLSLATNAPEAIVTEFVRCGLPLSALTLSGNIPTATTTEFDDIISEISTLAVSLTANVPSITLSDLLQCQLPSEVITLLAQAPSPYIYEPIAYLSINSSIRPFDAQAAAKTTPQDSSQRSLSAESQNKIYSELSTNRTFSEEHFL